MRSLILVAMVGCAPSSPPTPTMVIVRDTLMNRDIVEQSLEGGSAVIDSGCTVGSVAGAAVVKCPKFAIRFDCRDHITRPIGVLIESVGYELRCK